MKNLNKGDIIENEYEERKALSVLEEGELYAMSDKDNFDKSFGIYTHKELEEKDCKLPAEKWVPNENEDYWTIDCQFTHGFEWCNDEVDNLRLKNNVVFQTETEAEEALDKVKQLLKEL